MRWHQAKRHRPSGSVLHTSGRRFDTVRAHRFRYRVHKVARMSETVERDRRRDYDIVAERIRACRRCEGMNIPAETQAAPGHGSLQSPVVIPSWIAHSNSQARRRTTSSPRMSCTATRPTTARRYLTRSRIAGRICSGSSPWPFTVPHTTAPDAASAPHAPHPSWIVKQPKESREQYVISLTRAFEWAFHWR